MSSDNCKKLDDQSNQTLEHLQTLPNHKLDAERKQQMLATLLREEKKDLHKNNPSTYFTWISKGIVCSTLVLATFWLGNSWIQQNQPDQTAPLNSNNGLVSATPSEYRESRGTDSLNTFDTKQKAEKNGQEVPPDQNKLLLNIMDRARTGNILHTNIAVKTSLVDDVKKVYGEPKQTLMRFGLPTVTYPEKSLAFAYNKGDQLVEIISTDSRLTVLNKEQVEHVLGKPLIVQQYTDQLKYSYPAGDDYQLVFYFTPTLMNNGSVTPNGSVANNKVSLNIEHVSVVYPDGRKNLMLGDNIDFTQKINDSASHGNLLVEDFVVGLTTKEQIEQRWGKADKTDTPYKTTYAVYRNQAIVVGYDSNGLLVEVRSFDLRLQDIRLSEVKKALGEKIKGYFNRNKEQVFTYPLSNEYQFQVVVTPATDKNTDPFVDHVNVIHRKAETWEK